MSDKGVAVIRIVFLGLIFWKICSIPDAEKPDPTQCDIAPTSSELISELEQATKTLIEPEIAIDPTPSPSDKPKVAKREIVIFSADWCEPCQRWKRCEQSKFADAGYTFAHGNPDDVSRVPYFIVTDGDKTVEISGYMTLDRLNAELAK